MTRSSVAVHGVSLSRANFATPPMEMGILPFWFWNGAMDEKEMAWQLQEYKDKGITGMFIHGRFGLKVPYVSDAWFEKVKVAVDLAKKVGIDAWIYDEMNWPSGTAERKVPTQFPHLTQKYLELVALNVDGPLFTFLEATDNRYVNTGDSYPVAAFGCTEEEFQTSIRNPIDLTQNLSFEKVLPWEAPAGKWRLLYFLQKEVPYYIDTLNPESTRRFLDLTHERYHAAVGSEFGATVPGFYTDEPAMHYYHVGIDNYVIPWSAQMFKIFRERRGYDLRPLLPALYLDAGENTARVRYDFWRTLTEQYAESYYGQIRTWCEGHNTLFTGHLLFEEWMRMHARCEGNLFKYLEKLHVVGVDHLYPKIGTPQEPDQHVALKIASSAAHHFGSTRLLCESMGGSYWDCSLQRMKWIANWEYVLGVNLFNNHGYHYSIEGERKRDWPPSQFYHHTWWKYYDTFTRYMARMSHVLSGGTHVAKVLMLYPLSSIWTNYVPQNRTAVGNVVEGDFNYLTDTLLRLHYDFDYVEEDILAGAEVKDGMLHIRDEAYSMMILPPVTHIKEATFLKLEAFVRAGGTLVADTLLPIDLLENSGGGAAARVKRLFKTDAQAILKAFESETAKPRIRSHAFGRGTVHVIEGMGLHTGTRKDELRRVLTRSVVADVEISDEEVFYLHRVKDGFDLYYFVNTSREARNGVTISLERAGVPELWNIATGTMVPLALFAKEKGRVTFRLDFPAAEAHMIMLAPDAGAPHAVAANVHVDEVREDAVSVHGQPSSSRVRVTVRSGRKEKKLSTAALRPLRPIVLPAAWDCTLEGDNALLLTQWRMQVGTPGDDIWAQPGFDDAGWLAVKPGAWEMQLPQEREEATYPEVVCYRMRFDAAFVPPDLRVLIDGFSGSPCTLFVNGKRIDDPGSRSSLDAEIREVDIADAVHPGENVIGISMTVHRRTDGLLDPVKLVGAFRLAPVAGSWRIEELPGTITASDWTAGGYPFYSGTMRYGATVNVPAAYTKGKLYLSAACGEDVLEVRINSAPPVVVPWHPYRVDVTGLLTAGENRIELLVTNTLMNILEGVLTPSGLLGRPKIEHEHLYTLSF